jgi:hypothetical protein
MGACAPVSDAAEPPVHRGGGHLVHVDEVFVAGDAHVAAEFVDGRRGGAASPQPGEREQPGVVPPACGVHDA